MGKLCDVCGAAFTSDSSSGDEQRVIVGGEGIAAANAWWAGKRKWWRLFPRRDVRRRIKLAFTVKTILPKQVQMRLLDAVPPEEGSRCDADDPSIAWEGTSVVEAWPDGR